MPTAANFNASETACQRLSANLASIHDLSDNDFVRNISKVNNVTTDAWIGLQAGFAKVGQYDWVDSSPDDNFINWAPTEPSQRDGCAYITKENGQWSDTNCTLAKPYVCKKGSLGVNASCVCTGVVDDKGFGGFCAKFNDNRTWCHTNQFCPRAVPVGNNKAGQGLYKTHCLTQADADDMTTEEPEVTTEPPTCHVANPAQYTRDDGKCATCTTLANCTRSQVLVGDCGERTTPNCVDCHPSCLTCSGLGSLSCTACAVGYNRALDGACRALPRAPRASTLTAASAGRATLHAQPAVAPPQGMHCLHDRQ